jgi:putative tryptophan/tyrosine transport system substrate-binding protein
VKRRAFITLLGGAASLRTRSSQRCLGYVNSGTADANVKNIDAFRAGLTEAGFVEGQMSRSNSAGPKTSSIGCQR